MLNLALRHHPNHKIVAVVTRLKFIKGNMSQSDVVILDLSYLNIANWWRAESMF